MGDVLTGLKGKLSQFTARQITLVGVLAAVAIAIIVGLTRWVGAPTYDVLYSGLEPSDANAVVEVIEAAGIPHQISASGATSTVMVPAGEVDRLRLTLAAENLPADSVVGYEILDSQGVTVSTFREQVNYQRGLQGEIARTLMTLDSVAKASVHIVLPEEKLYKDEEKPATASVTLSTNGTLDKGEVKAITNLVAAAVPELDPDNVSVTDSNGTLLTANGENGFGDEADAETAYAARMEAAATSMLAKIVGPDNAIVRVQTDLDFTARTRQAENFDPEDTAVNTQKVESEQYTTRDPDAEGLLTTDPEEDVEAQTPPSTEYARESNDSNYSISREVTSETDAPGAVRRMSVSVLIDPDQSQVDIEQAEQIVANAVGLDPERGDQIVVQMLPFAQGDDGDDAAADAEKAAADAAKRKAMITWAWVGVAALAVLALAFFLFRSLRRRSEEQAEFDENGDRIVDDIAQGAPGTTSLDSGTQLGVPSSEVGEADRLRERVMSRPEEAAKAISGIIAADKGRKA